MRLKTFIKRLLILQDTCRSALATNYSLTIMSEECCNADKICSVHIHTIVIKILVQEVTIYSKMAYTQKGLANRSLERSGSVQ